MYTIPSARIHISSRIDDDAVWNSNVRVREYAPVCECVRDRVNVECVSSMYHPSKFVGNWEGING